MTMDATYAPQSLQRQTAQLQSSPTGAGLLLGTFVLPFAPGAADPTAQIVGVADGLTLLWITGGVLKLSTFSATLGAWRTLTYA